MLKPLCGLDNYKVSDNYNELLHWHLRWGTKPGCSKTKPNDRYPPSVFYRRLFRIKDVNGNEEINAKRKFSNWRDKNKSPPKEPEVAQKIEILLFDDDESLNDWRDDLRNAWHFRYKKNYFLYSSQEQPVDDIDARRVEANLSAQGLPSIDRSAVEFPAGVATDLTELLAIVRSGYTLREPNDSGIAEPAVRAIVERLGGDGVASSELVAWLGGWIEAASRHLERQVNISSPSEMLRAAAERRRLSSGDKEQADPLTELIEEERQISLNRQNELLLESVLSDLRSGKILDSARKLRFAKEIDKTINESDLIHGLIMFGEVIINGGIQRDNDQIIFFGMCICLAAFEITSPEKSLDDWILASLMLGNALSIVGRRDHDTIYIERGTFLISSALEKCSPEQDIETWTCAQNILSNSLYFLWIDSDDLDTLYNAEKLYRLLLSGSTDELENIDRVKDRAKFSSLLLKIGNKTQEAWYFNECIGESCKVADRLCEVGDDITASVQLFNMGMAAFWIGKEEGQIQYIEECIDLLREAIKDFSVLGAAPAVAEMRVSIGVTFIGVFNILENSDLLQEAINYLSAAFNYHIKNINDPAWFISGNHLGFAYCMLGMSTDDCNPIERGLEVFKSMITVSTEAAIDVEVELLSTHIQLATDALSKISS